MALPWSLSVLTVSYVFWRSSRLSILVHCFRSPDDLFSYHVTLDPRLSPWLLHLVAFALLIRAYIFNIRLRFCIYYTFTCSLREHFGKP